MGQPTNQGSGTYQSGGTPQSKILFFNLSFLVFFLWLAFSFNQGKTRQRSGSPSLLDRWGFKNDVPCMTRQELYSSGLQYWKLSLGSAPGYFILRYLVTYNIQGNLGLVIFLGFMVHMLLMIVGLVWGGYLLWNGLVERHKPYQIPSYCNRKINERIQQKSPPEDLAD
jgi:hypothetical protein